MRGELAAEITALKARGVTPGLAVVLVGDNPASQVYVRMKGRACGEAGLHHETIRLPKETSEAELLQTGPGGNATVTVCHSRTRNIGAVTVQADLLIVAIGKPQFVTGDMVKPGAVVIDVGVNRIDDPSLKSGYRLVGDVHFDQARRVAAAITPVPGGVGPMTITMLLYNTVQAARQWVDR